MTQTKITNRVEWVDIARGIAIILMVAGHTSIPESLSKYIWSFHMPLFFVVSGLFYKPDKYSSFKEIFKAKFKTLIIPYCFFSLIVFFGYIGTEYYRPYELYLGWEGYALWFVPVLFFAELLFYPISKLKTKYMVPLVLAITLFGYGMSKFHVLLPFKIDSVPFALFFVTYGYLAKDFLFKYKLPIVYVTLIGTATVVLSQFLPKLGIGRNEFGCIVPNLFNALLGCYFIFSLSKCLSLRIFQVIKYFGKNSIFVMAFSQLFNYYILTILATLSWPGAILLGLRYLILFVTIYVVGELLKKYLPFCIGK